MRGENVFTTPGNGSQPPITRKSRKNLRKAARKAKKASKVFKRAILTEPVVPEGSEPVVETRPEPALSAMQKLSTIERDYECKTSF